MMKQKSAVIAGIVLAMICGTTVSGAEKETSVTSSFHTGQVRIRLEQSENLYEKDLQNILPGKPINMNPQIQNLGEDCYVRVKIMTESEKEKEIPFHCFHGISENWVIKGEYLYYTKVLEEDEKTDIFQTFVLPDDWNQDGIEHDIIQVKMLVDAIQSRNFTPDFEKEDPWRNVEIKEAQEPKNGYRFRLLNQKTGVCKVKIEDEEMIAVSDPFFEELGRMVPGDIASGQIEISNHADVPKKLYVKIRADAQKALLEKANLKILSEDGTVFYDGALISDMLDQFHFLKEYQKEETEPLTFFISIPEELDNDYSLKDAKMTWTFRTEEKQDLKQEEDSKKESVKTGEQHHREVLFMTLGGAIALLAVSYKMFKKYNEKIK
nr:hypothetical protein [uncultured Sellimonas sp.]